MSSYGMRLCSRILTEELWAVIDSDVVHANLHGSKEVMIKVRDMDCLVDNEMELLSGPGLSVGNSS